MVDTEVIEGVCKDLPLRVFIEMEQQCEVLQELDCEQEQCLVQT